MATRTITAKTQAWLNEWSGPDDLIGDADRAINKLSFYAAPDRKSWEAQGYTFAGHATITVEVADERELIDSKVESLRAQKTKVLGDAHAAATEIESKIQKLLAIGYAGEVAA